jgi:hypothetical protein
MAPLSAANELAGNAVAMEIYLGGSNDTVTAATLVATNVKAMIHFHHRLKTARISGMG